jgi:enoyl-CoA hydratase
MNVHVERNGPVTTVILDRREARNAVDKETARQLADAFREFDADSSASVAVLYGAGGSFCSGADLKAMDSRLGIDGDGPMGPTRMRLSKPVIAAVEGYAVAGGLELAVWADLRVVAEDAIFGVFSRRWGVPLIDGGTVRLPRLIGEGRAMDLILTGRPVDAAEALAIGLANRVVATGTTRASAEQLALELTEFPQACLRSDRLSVLAQEPSLAREFELGHKVLAAAAEGAARFTGGAGRHGAWSCKARNAGSPSGTAAGK